MKSIKKILSLVLAIACVITCFSVNTLTASALTQSSSYPKSTIGAYIISTNNKTAKAYSDQACTKSIGYIYSTDYCTIKAIYTNGVVQVGCPWSGYSGNRTVYTKLSYFFASTSVSVKTATVKTKCYYRTDLQSSPGSVYVGDKCYIVGTSGNYYQVLCPWSSGNTYRLVWVNKSAFGHSHNYSTTGFEAAHPHKVYKKCSCGAYYYTGETKKYSSCTTCYPVHNHNYSTTGFEAAHPHKVYKKCSCGAYYYTGETKKYSSCTTCYPPSSSTYSVSGNVVTLKGVRLYEYPIGEQVPSSSYYFNVNGKSTYVGAKQCYGFACYCQMKLYGSCYHTNSSHFPNLSGSCNIKPNAATLKSLITSAGAGAHLRTQNGHSMIIAGITSNGFTVVDANSSGNCKVEIRTYTWDSYLSSSYGKSGIKFIEIYK